MNNHFWKKLQNIRNSKNGNGLLVAAKQMALYQRMKFILDNHKKT